MLCGCVWCFLENFSIGVFGASGGRRAEAKAAVRRARSTRFCTRRHRRPSARSTQPAAPARLAAHPDPTTVPAPLDHCSPRPSRCSAVCWCVTHPSRAVRPLRLSIPPCSPFAIHDAARRQPTHKQRTHRSTHRSHPHRRCPLPLIRLPSPSFITAPPRRCHAADADGPRPPSTGRTLALPHDKRSGDGGCDGRRRGSSGEVEGQRRGLCAQLGNRSRWR